MLLSKMLNRCLEILSVKLDDRKAISVIHNFLEEGYQILGDVDERTSTAYIPNIMSSLNLPEDCVKVIKTLPDITNNVKDRVGNVILLDYKSDETQPSIVEMQYSTRRDDLKDDEEPDLDKLLQYAMIDYACYRYLMLTQQNYSLANMYYGNFQRAIQDFKDKKDDGILGVDHVVIVED